MTNVVKATNDNVKAVCQILCERDYIDAQEIAYYAQIGGFTPHKDVAGNEYYKFEQKYTRANYYRALADALFIDKPKEIDRAEVISALDFFLTSFGETNYNAWRFSMQLGASPILKALNLTESLQGGEKDTSEG